MKPLRDFLVGKICQSIKTKEVTPTVLKLSIDGDINPEETFISYEDLCLWLAKRGLLTDLPEYDKELSRSYNHIIEYAEIEAEILNGKLTGKIDDKIRHNKKLAEYYIAENLKLKKDLDEANKKLNHYKSKDNKLTETERTSLLKLIYGMAKAAYRYNPDMNRNNAKWVEINLTVYETMNITDIALCNKNRII